MTTSLAFRTYELPNVLYANVSVVLNPVERVLTQIAEDELEVQCVLSEQEMRVIIALFEAAPNPCSYIALYAAVTEMSPERVDLLFGLLGDEVPSLASEVARPVLQRCRAILDTFNIGIQPVKDAGYGLCRL